MAACQSCGTDNRPGARFCSVCGQSLGQAPSGKARGGPAAPAPAPPPAAPRGPGRRQPAWLLPVVSIVAVVVVGGAVGLAVAQGGVDDSSDSATPTDADESSGPTEDPDEAANDSADADSGDLGEPPPAETTDAPETAQPAVRSGTLFSNRARLRTGPNIVNPIVTTLTRDRGALQILGEPRDGWYEILMDGARGWIFGAFVLPPPADHRILVARSGTIVLRNASGAPLGITNESGPKALATGSAGNLWQVILPDGTTAHVRRGEVTVAAG